jgi:4-hydroxybenzoate polyprenyltransferase/phosphoserine phosphatase
MEQTMLASPIESTAATQPPLVVDLDGTLVKSDLLLESVVALLRRQPLYAFLLPVWMLRGIARFKQEVARRVVLDPCLLPWRRELIDYLEGQRAEGRCIVLATASDGRIARQVAAHLQLFDSILASDGVTNLAGGSKRDRLIREFGEKGFDYAGDSGRDLVVWSSARRAIVVDANGGLKPAVTKVTPVDRVFEDARRSPRDYLKALRLRNWAKNLLVFVPLLAAHRVQEIGLLGKGALAFVALGCCASAGYLLNDLLDLEADRHHPEKRLRPFAAGKLPLAWAFAMISALLGLGCVVGALVSPAFLAALLFYFALSVTYSLFLKKIVILDVLVLAGLHSARILAGSAAVGVGLSHWLLAFSTFLFFSLALVKRYSELVVMREVDGGNAHARAYELGDAELLSAMGTASGYLAVLVLALYIASDTAHVLYAQRNLLWFLCPLMFYWISQVWLTAHRGKMRDDPLVFAAGDRTSRILILLMLVTVILAQ